MSFSKPLPDYTFDVLCYLKRDRLERLSLVCRALKKLIDRYFILKPYRLFDELLIRPGLYALVHNHVQWHPNRNDYIVQQFLDGQTCTVDQQAGSVRAYYSFDEMRKYLDSTVRISDTTLYVAGNAAYNAVHVAEIESIAYAWQNQCVGIWRASGYGRIIADDFQLILNSPTIMQCNKLKMFHAHFSFKDYNVLYTLKFLEIFSIDEEYADPNYITNILEQPVVKPIVILRLYPGDNNFTNLLERLLHAFSSALQPSGFTIIFDFLNKNAEQLAEFLKTNKTSGEKLELKKGNDAYYHYYSLNLTYTLKRYMI